MPKLKTIFTTALLSYLTPLLARAKYGLEEAAGPAGLMFGFTVDTLPGKIGGILGMILSLLGVIFLILLIYGGFLWMTAGGASDQVKKATGIMKNAVIGVIIILLSYALTYFVFDTLLGTGP